MNKAISETYITDPPDLQPIDISTVEVWVCVVSSGLGWAAVKSYDTEKAARENLSWWAERVGDSGKPYLGAIYKWPIKLSDLKELR